VAASDSEPRRAELASGIGRDPGAMKKNEDLRAPKGKVLSVATSEHDYARYLKAVRKKIQLSWILGHAMDPRLNYATEDGRPVIVDFVIRPDGRLKSVEIHDNAGNPYLAGAVKKNIMDAGPFPGFKAYKVLEPEISIRFHFYTQ
jgi:TonB family protein